MEFKPIKTKKIYEEIVDQIKDKICRGELSPGDKLVAERDMAVQMKVGRSAVREAFRSLEAMGIIEIRPGEGTFIRRTSTDSFLETLTLILMTEKDTVKELLELRKILEVEGAGLAALRQVGRDLVNMEAALALMEADLDSGNLGDEADLQFHYAVAEATGNSLLVKLMQTISGTMKTALKVSREQLYRTPGTPQRLLREHRIIYEAIKRGDKAGARQAMYDHLDKVEKALSK